MRVNSLTILHYGKDFLNYALRSVYPCVERSFVIYTPHPSHGHRTDTPPVESRDELMASIPANEWDKLTWIDVDRFWNEGAHRDYALSVASQNADLVAVVDYDEVWSEVTLDKVLKHVWDTNGARQWLINFSHLWRSFNWVCHDQNWPVRVIDTRHSGGTGYVPKELGDIYHLGYCITDRVMSYKMRIHGHKDELRPGWYEEKWQAWPPPDDCHPTNGKNDEGVGWWNPEPFDKRELPYVMHSHPWFNVDRIE